MPYPRTILLPLSSVDGPSLTGTAALVDGTPLPAAEIPAHLLQVQGRVMTYVKGRFTSTGTPGTVVFGLYLAKSAVAIGSAAILAVSSAIVPLASQTNKTFELEFETQIVSIGAGGAGVGQMRGSGKALGVVAAGSIDFIPATAPFTAVNLDTTASERLLVGITPSVTTGTWLIHSMLSEYTGN